MIVISGALVLVAAVLLVLGIVSSITLVYAAIGLSIVSAVFLLVGVFQRPPPPGQEREEERAAPKRSQEKPKKAEQRDEEREEPEAADDAGTRDEQSRDDSQGDETKEADTEQYAAADEHAGEGAEDDHAYADDSADFPLEEANAKFEEQAGATGADVLVISGRPRYHVGGCEDVEGHGESEPLDIIEARELGFTPCGKCRPNETLARGAASHDEPDEADREPADQHDDDHATDQADHHADHADQPADAEPEQPEKVSAAAAVDHDSRGGDDGQAADTHAAPDHRVGAEPVKVSATAAPALADSAFSNGAAQPAQSSQPAQASQPAQQPQPAQPVATAAPAPAATPLSQAPPPTSAPVSQTPPPEVAAPAAAAGSTPSSAAARPRRAGRSSVIAVTATKEYHRADCELLNDADGEETTKTAAIRKGFLACGVCKP